MAMSRKDYQFLVQVIARLPLEKHERHIVAVHFAGYLRESKATFDKDKFLRAFQDEDKRYGI